MLFETGKYANLRICIKILLKKTQSLEIPLPVTCSTLIYATIYKGPETSSDANTFTNLIERYSLQQTTGTLQSIYVTSYYVHISDRVDNNKERHTQMTLLVNLKKKD